jgi:hypothetical protein
VIANLIVGHLGYTPIPSIGARDLDGLQDTLYCEAPVIGCADGAQLAIVVLQELLIAGRANNMTGCTL